MAVDLLPPIVAHRGASATAPENTLAAFGRAAQLGATWIEFDVRLARCGTPVVIHDPTLERTTNGHGPVDESSADALAGLDAGAWFGDAFAGEGVPTLAATLSFAEAHGLGCNVEVKAESIERAETTAAAIAPLLLVSGAAYLVSSFALEALRTIRALAPTIRLGLLVGRRTTTEDVVLARQMGCVSFHAHARAYDGRLIEKLRTTELWPVAYTVNDPRHARDLLELGVKTIITDRPAELAAGPIGFSRSDG
ncbi:MAG: glycerophosphodiester phosphodiesterase family protein [Pseudomonadota bacterium]